MDIDYNSFKRFNLKSAEAWGRKNYGNWFLELQNQNYEPKTPVEEFLDIILKVYMIFLIRLLDFMLLIYTTLVKVFLQKKCLIMGFMK